MGVSIPEISNGRNGKLGTVEHGYIHSESGRVVDMVALPILIDG